jgi:hypothetical protein
MISALLGQKYKDGHELTDREIAHMVCMISFCSSNMLLKAGTVVDDRVADGWSTYLGGDDCMGPFPHTV